MGELTRDNPKPLLEVGGKSVLEHDLEALPDEVDEVILVVGYLGEKIREKFGNGYRKPLTFDSSPLKSGEEGAEAEKVINVRYVEQKELKGTADALWACKDLLKDRFLLLHGDDIYAKEDIERLVKEPLAILVYRTKTDEIDKNRSGALVIVGSEGNLVDIIERQPIKAGDFQNAGAYMLDKKVFDYPLASAGTPSDEYGLPQTFIQMIKAGRKMSVVEAARLKRIVTPEDLT